MWSPYSTRPRRDNGLRPCCSREPMLRVHPTMMRGEAYLVFFECRSCGKAGELVNRTPAMVDEETDADEVQARVGWQLQPG